MRSLADLAGVPHVRLPEVPPCPPVPIGREPVYLLDASTGLEEALLRAWVERCHPEGARVLRLTPSRIRRPNRRTDPALSVVVEEENRWWLVPLRIVWMPAERHGRRTVSWVDLLKLGDPRDPRWFRDYAILFLFPDRVRIVVGEGAGPSDLRQAYQQSDTSPPLIEFITRRAHRVLDRAERKERGNRYKVPRFLHEEILERREFVARVVRLGRERNLSGPQALRRARYYMREMAATHSPFLIDLIANLIHWVIRQGYGAIHYSRQDLDRIARIGNDHPLVFLPSHKSNLDRLSLQFILWENDLPPNHTAGGINMNFFPVGALMRRTGVFFIRRSFKDNSLYKYVLRTYLDYLIERRFPLEWYMEGGRSRTGKLRPPRFGLLSWVVDSLDRDKAEDIYLIPISIAYDQIQEVGAYVAEATGSAKERETFSWALKFARNLRRRYGDIHISFAEPISVSDRLGPASIRQPNAVRKLALEVMYRISLATPVTPTALVAIALLAAKGRARDAETLARVTTDLDAYIQQRKVPTTTALPTASDEVSATLGLMKEHNLVSSLTVEGRTVWWMDREDKLRASYYSNAVLHYFMNRGLTEVALHASDLESFWRDVFDLRDLFKFEFFFAQREQFRSEIETELGAEHPGWENEVESGKGRFLRLEPSVVGFTVTPLLEAYLVVADEIEVTPGEIETDDILGACLERGRLYRLEGLTESDESVSKAIYNGALLLARNRGLTEAEAGPDGRRGEFAAQLRHYLAAARAGSAMLVDSGSSPAGSPGSAAERV